jgi:predicted permease
MTESGRPPRWAAALLRLAAPSDDRDALIDELQDEFEREIARQGVRGARTWYVCEVLRSLPPVVARRMMVPTRQPVRPMTMRSRLETVRFDLSYAMRQLQRAPGFTVTVLLAFALGIGANATMFGIVDRLLFRAPAHVRAPGDVVTLAAGTAADGFAQRALNYPVFAAIRDYGTGFSDIAAVANVSVPLGRGDRAASLDGLLVSASYFPLLGVTPARGRFFDAAEDVAPIGAPVAVISHAFWQRQFAGSMDVLGATIPLGDRPFTVIGIAPREFTGLDYSAPDVWLPLSSGGAMQFLGTRWTTQSVVTWLRIYARLKPGAPPAAAANDAMRVAREAAPEAFFTQPGWSFQARPIQAARGEERGASTTIATLLAAMSFMVLLIACANVSNLLLARGIRRRREMAVRLALGVTRGRLVMQLLTESLLLATIGGAAAVFVANWAGVLARRLLLGDLEFTGHVLDGRVLVFTAVVALLVGVFTGIVPALQASRAPVFSTIVPSSDRGGPRRSRVQRALLTVQAALSFVLLLGAGLFGRSLVAVNSLRLGVDVDRVFVGSMDLRSIGRPASEADAVFSRALEQVASVPGIASAAISTTVPFGPSYGTQVGITGPDSIKHYTTTYNVVTPDYFRTLGASLFAGRDFSEADREGMSRVVIINEMLATRGWGSESPLGRCLRVGEDHLPCATVVGVVENVRRQSIFEDSTNFVYLPLDQARSMLSERFIVARVTGEPALLAESVRRAMQTAAPSPRARSTAPRRCSLRRPPRYPSPPRSCRRARSVRCVRRGSRRRARCAPSPRAPR